MRSSLPSSAMDCSPDSCTAINFSLQHASIPNIYKLLPNLHSLEPIKGPLHLFKSKHFTPQLFPVSAAQHNTIPHLTNTVSKFLNLLTSSGNPGIADKQHTWLKFGREAGQRIGGQICNVVRAKGRQRAVPLFASVSGGEQESVEATSVFQLALSENYVARRLEGVSLYTVSNNANEFVLVTDPNSPKALGLMCFRKQDAFALLKQVQLRQPGLTRGAKVVPLSLQQVYTLKAEGIAFRFVPDPDQVRHALAINRKNPSKAFDGVPVFQSDLVVVKKKNQRFCPLYFCKEDLDKDLLRIRRGISKSAELSSDIVVGSLEAALKKMQESKMNSGWEDLVFIPPGKSYTLLLQKISV